MAAIRASCTALISGFPVVAGVRGVVDLTAASCRRCVRWTSRSDNFRAAAAEYRPSFNLLDCAEVALGDRILRVSRIALPKNERYPRKISSAPSPVSTTVTCFLASLERRNLPTGASETNGSSENHTDLSR